MSDTRNKVDFQRDTEKCPELPSDWHASGLNGPRRFLDNVPRGTVSENDERCISLQEAQAEVDHAALEYIRLRNRRRMG